MDKKVLLIIGILLAIVGIGLFIERGFFAETFMGATVFGNTGWASRDDAKIQTIAITGGVSLVTGVIITIAGVLKKDKSEKS